MIETIRQGLKDDGYNVSIAKLCRWFNVPRRTMYYKPVKNSVPKIQERFAKPIKAMIEENPSFGYRTVAWLLGFNKNTMQRIFQLKGWQVRKRSIGFRPRVEALPSVAAAPNERWYAVMAYDRNLLHRIAHNKTAWWNVLFVRLKNNARFESIQHASRAISDWITFYNHQ